MAALKFYVEWHFEGNAEEKKEYDRKASMYQNEYTKAYNRFCDVSNNGLIDELNKAWDGLHPGVNGEDPRYMKFVQIGYNAAIRAMKLESKHMTYSAGNECQFIGHLKTGGILYFTLKPC